tara:strand:+ start:2265 stop:3002 length:738 start_codon:yes stop_codon:yes gene_type:complete
MSKNLKNTIIENFKTLLYALLIALVIRSLFFQPFYIPSSSMEPTLLIGDRIFVSKYTYGYSKHSLPFSPKIYNSRLFFKEPNYGDLVVFKTPVDNRTDYIKRLIGKPGDSVQFINGEIFLNKEKILRKKVISDYTIRCGKSNLKVDSFEETLPNGVVYRAVYSKNFSLQNSDEFIVPQKHYFFLGDNRDCSQDSRFLNSVGYVNYINLVGEAKIIFFSNDTIKGSALKIWNWKESFRFNRTFKNL